MAQIKKMSKSHNRYSGAHSRVATLIQTKFSKKTYPSVAREVEKDCALVVSFFSVLQMALGQREGGFFKKVCACTRHVQSFQLFIESILKKCPHALGHISLFKIFSSFFFFFFSFFIFPEETTRRLVSHTLPPLPTTLGGSIWFIMSARVVGFHFSLNPEFPSTSPPSTFFHPTPSPSPSLCLCLSWGLG